MFHDRVITMLHGHCHHNAPEFLSSQCSMAPFITMLHEPCHHNVPCPGSGCFRGKSGRMPTPEAAGFPALSTRPSPQPFTPSSHSRIAVLRRLAGRARPEQSSGFLSWPGFVFLTPNLQSSVKCLANRKHSGTVTLHPHPKSWARLGTAAGKSGAQGRACRAAHGPRLARLSPRAARVAQPGSGGPSARGD